MASAFDKIIAQDESNTTPAGGGGGQNDQSTPDDKQTELIKQLLSFTGDKAGGSSTSAGGNGESGNQDDIDFSSLFGLEEASANTNKATKPAQADDPSTTSPDNGVEAEVSEGQQFLDQINDDKIVAELINGMKPQESLALPKELAATFDAETGEFSMTPEIMTTLLQQTTLMARQQSMRQTIDLIRELVPAVIESSKTSAVGSIQNSNELNKTFTIFKDNKPLRDLAEHMAKGKTITDGEAYAQKIIKLMDSITKNELNKVNAKKPPEQGLGTFLGSVTQ